MQYHIFGEYKISRLGLGTVQFGLDYGYTKKLSRSEIEKILDVCGVHGINFLDTARDYGDSENQIGNYLQRHPSSNFVVATKINVIPRAACGSRRKLEQHIRKSIDASRKALRCDRIHVLQLHNTSNYVIENEHFWDLIAELTHEQLFAYFGVSFYEPEIAVRCLTKYGSLIRLVQAPFNIIDQRFLKIRSLLKRNQAFFVSRSTFLKGLIVADENEIQPELSAITPVRKKLESFSQESGFSKSEIALLSVYDMPSINTVLVGVKSSSELLANIHALEKLKSFRRYASQVRGFKTSNRFIRDPRKWNIERNRPMGIPGKSCFSKIKVRRKKAATSPDVLCVIQARTGSTRLPGKILKPIIGKPMLLRQLERVRLSRKITRLVVATTTDPADDVVVKLCLQNGIPCFRGSVSDVLDRYYQSAYKFQAEHIVRITGDCPLIDPQVIDQVIEFYFKHHYDYASCNRITNTFPDGLDVEIFSFKALTRAHREAELPSEREHVTPYFYKNPKKFRLGDYQSSRNLAGNRWTVDETEDFEFINQIYKALYPSKHNFTTQDVIKLLRKKPALKEINNHFRRNEGYEKSLEMDKKWLFQRRAD